MRVARRVQGVLVHEGQAERTAQGGEQLHGRLLDAAVGGTMGQQRADDVGIRGRRGALDADLTRARRELRGVDQIAVVAQRNPVPASVVRKIGWEFSQVVDPVVE